jgi:hypothetical protein
VTGTFSLFVANLSEDSFLSYILPALIGAMGGSIGGNFLTDWFARRTEKERIRRELVDKYLIQLQDNLESLWFRLDNMKYQDGLQKMTDYYYEISTLYILGSVLAHNRILAYEGVYTKMEKLIPGLGNFLRDKMNQFGSYLDKIDPNIHFYQYDRIALAEAVMSFNDERHFIASYLQFGKQYEDPSSNLKTILSPAKEFISKIKSKELDLLMEKISEIANKIDNQTGITTGIKNSTY